ncbi:MAG: hypothetical protein HY040_14590 [Planctomycetes bacterium]|nr:hypothetical protein [Planctomycetota bacterium]
MLKHTRRDFLAASALAAPVLAVAPAFSALAGQQPRRRPRVAAIYTSFYNRSHAHVILQCFLRPYLFNGKLTDPGVDMVSFYADQRVAKGDMTDDTARQFKVPIFKTISDALTLGGKDLAVDAVLSIGEHGDYPTNKLGQVEYPRKRFFDEIVAVMRRSDRFVPLFNDKHLSYRWDWSREMVDTARKHRIPFMAGSSVPLAQRRTELDIREGAQIEEAVSIHGGGLESYDFHGFEVLQSFAEFRKGGETGISHVEFLTGDALWKAANDRRWSQPLAEAALRAEFGKNLPDMRRPFPNENPAPAHAILLTYRDGMRATILKLGRSSTRWHFACKINGEHQPRVTSFNPGPWGNRCLFMALSHAIQHCFREREAPYPVERTLLASGVLEAAMQSRDQRRRLATANLEFAYAARDFRAFRELGASWKELEGVPEPTGINPIGRKK